MTTQRFVSIDHEWIKDGEPQYFLCETIREPVADDMTMGDLFRNLRSWHGRCDGSIYVDTLSGKTKRIGWHFIKRCDDGNGCIGTWASVYHQAPPEAVEVGDNRQWSHSVRSDDVDYGIQECLDMYEFVTAVSDQEEA